MFHALIVSDESDIDQETYNPSLIISELYGFNAFLWNYCGIYVKNHTSTFSVFATKVVQIFYKQEEKSADFSADTSN